MNIKTFKKGIERNYLRSKRMLRLNPHDDFSKGFSEALEGVQGMYPLLNDSGKVKIPEYVAKYLEWMRDVNQFKEPYIILNSVMSGMCAGTDVEKEGSQTAHWLEDRPKNIKTFVEACSNGYEVKEDPKYRIKLPGLAGSNGQQYISKSADGKLFACAYRDYLQQEFTNDELKQLPDWIRRLELEEVED